MNKRIIGNHKYLGIYPDPESPEFERDMTRNMINRDGSAWEPYALCMKNAPRLGRGVACGVAKRQSHKPGFYASFWEASSWKISAGEFVS